MKTCKEYKKPIIALLVFVGIVSYYVWLFKTHNTSVYPDKIPIVVDPTLMQLSDKSAIDTTAGIFKSIDVNGAAKAFVNVVQLI